MALSTPGTHIGLPQRSHTGKDCRNGGILGLRPGCSGGLFRLETILVRVRKDLDVVEGCGLATVRMALDLDAVSAAQGQSLGQVPAGGMGVDGPGRQMIIGQPLVDLLAFYEQTVRGSPVVLVEVLHGQIIPA